MSHTTLPPLPYDPTTLRARRPAIIIPALTRRSRRCSAPSVGRGSTKLFAHIPAPARMVDPPACLEELSYAELYQHVVAQSQKNRLPDMAFLGDGFRTTASLTWCRRSGLREFDDGLYPLSARAQPGHPHDAVALPVLPRHADGLRAINCLAV